MLTMVEAFSRLNAWKEDKTSLQVHVSGSRLWADVWGVIREAKVKDTVVVVEIGSGAGTLNLGVREAFFEWRDDAPSTSPFSAALAAKFSNGDEILFSALRTPAKTA